MRRTTTAPKSRTAQKIQLLKNLINHPRTGEEERDAARRMLKRVMDKAREKGEQLAEATAISERSNPSGGYRLPGVVYGAKYEQVKNMPLAEIAKLMRADIRLARKVGANSATPDAVAVIDPLGDMPKEVKVSVTSEYFSGGGAIRMRVKNIPLRWGFAKEPDRWGEMQWMPSPSFKAVLDELRAIHGAYNFDGSDPMVDHYHVNYYGSVDYDRPHDRA